jgi:bleomycin hydrolase
MKKLTLFLSAVILSTGVIYAQQISTNIEGSKYQFTKVISYEATPVESQGMTGTCWSFSALSFLESELMRKGLKEVQPLSEMYIVRKAYEMKAEKYLRMDGKVNFSEGGAFHDIPLVIKNFGIVPYSIY